MEEDFPDDSLFRNSNVAYLEEALKDKENIDSRNGVSIQLLKEHDTVISEPVKSVNEKCKDGPCRPAKRTEPERTKTRSTKSDKNELSRHVEDPAPPQFTTARKILEASSSSANHPLSEQNPSASLESSSSDECGSTFKSKTRPTAKKKTAQVKERKVINPKQSQLESEDLSSAGSLSKKSSANKSTTSKKNTANSKAGTADEEFVKPGSSIKKKGYQPLQLNITRNSKHEDAIIQSKKSITPEKQSITEPEPSFFTSQSDARVFDMSTEKSALNEESECTDETLLTTQQRLQLESWGFPDTILQQYAQRGVTQMFPWQVECLCSPNVLSGGNLIYSAPTSAGKTLVAEILCIKTVLERRKKAIFILPFVSVVREKMFYFQDLLGSTGIRVEGFMGGHSPPGGFRCLDIAVCTIEKANGIVNRLLEDEGLSSLGAVVVDELHLLGDPFRGYLLELLLTKLRYMSKRNEGIQVQIVGMSATLPNLSLLATWLDAALYSTSYRPVPLQEFVKVGPQVYDYQLQPVRVVSPQITIKGDADGVIYLCLETVVAGHSVLIFCPTKNWCESLAMGIAEEFRKIGQSRDPNAPESIGYKLREELNANAIMQTLEQLKRCPAGLDEMLARTVSFGVSFHHAGMTLDERDVVEGAFRQGALRVIVATSTLSSGVNLPARRVIIRSPTFHGRLIDVLTYKQMAGRAGRMGKDTAGESYLICSKTDQRLAEQLVRSSLRPVSSCLGQKGISSSLKRAILEVIASGVAQTPEEVETYINCTLLAAYSKDDSEHSPESSSSSKRNTSFLDPVRACVEHLRENEFIRLQQCEDGTTKYVATPLGHACLSASISPDEGLTLFKELQRARQCFVLETELHIIYQVTPLSVSEQWGDLDWLHVLSLWEKLPAEMRKVGELVGVEDRFIVRAMKGTINLKSDKQYHRLLVHRRFYTALALNDLVNEVPISEVARKYGCSRGMLQSLQQSASTFAGMVTSFCRRLGWTSVEILVEQFQDRLHFGTHRELLDLLRLPLLNGPRARAIFNAGITTVTELTTADTTLIEDALLAATPFESEKGRDGESEHEMERRRRMKSVWVCGREGLTAREAAELLIAEARDLVQKELGVRNVNWQQAEMSVTFDESRSSRSRRNDLSVRSLEATTQNQNVTSSQVYNSRMSPGFDNSSNKEESVIFKVPECKLGLSSLRNAADSDEEEPVKDLPSKTVTDEKEPTKSSPSKIQRILRSIDIEPVKLPQPPEIIIGEKITTIKPEPSKPSTSDNQQAVEVNIRQDEVVEMNAPVEEAVSSMELPPHSQSLCETSNTSDLFDQNVFELDSALQSSVDGLNSTHGEANERKENSENKINECDEEPLSTRTTLTPDVKSQVSQKEIIKSPDVLFESLSLSESAFRDMSALRQPDNTKQNESCIKLAVKANEVQGAHSALSGDSGMGDVCFNMSSMNESAFTKNSIRVETKKTVEVPQIEESLEKKSRAADSEDIFASQTEERPTVGRVKRKSISSDGNMSSSFSKNILHTPSPPWNLRSRKNSGSSGSARRKKRRSIEDIFTSPVELNPGWDKSPSLFGDSFEIDSQLRKALDCNIPTTIPKLNDSASQTNTRTLRRCKRKDIESPVNNSAASFESPNSVDLSTSCEITKEIRFTRSAMRRKFLGSAKSTTTPEADLFSTSVIMANESGISQSTPMRPLTSGKSSKDQQDGGNIENVLTDSFLETAFQSAFECDDVKAEANSIPKPTDSLSPAPVHHLQYSPNEKDVAAALNNDDVILTTPSKKRKLTDKASKPELIRTPEPANDKRRKNRDALLNDDDKSSCEIIKESKALQSPKSTEKAKSDTKTVKKSKTEGLANPVGRPVGLSLPRSKVTSEKTTSTGVEERKRSLPAVHNNDAQEKPSGEAALHFTEKSDLVKRKNNSEWSKLNITDVCEDRQIFKEFMKSVFHRGSFSIAFGCERIPDSPKSARVVIGTRVVGIPKVKRKQSLKLEEPVFQYQKTRLVSLAICFGNTDVFHVALTSDPAKGSLPVSYEERLDFLRKLFVGDSTRVFACFDLKEQYKILFRCTGIAMSNVEARDLKIADWLIEPEEKEKNLHAMALKYYPPSSKVAEMSGCKHSRGVTSPGLNINLETPARTRACAEAVTCWHVSRAQMERMKDMHLLKSYTGVEMPVVISFARMELNGIGFDRNTALALRERLKNEMAVLQERAYELAGRTFSLSSTNDTARVIYQELSLGSVPKTPGRSFGAGGSCPAGQRQSTNKQALNRLRNEHPLPDVILMWRKLNSVMSKTFYPLLKSQAADRLYGSCILHTATGRISMHEPNLQNMPRDFEFPSDSQNFSVRASFVPKPGNILVSADYSQLELRLLAHLSGDITLKDILNSGRDVFRSIAGSWNKIPEDQVTDELRQRAKQVCYGMIYGIGKHALAEQLEVDDDEAETFMVSFKSAYPGVNTFLQDTVEDCRARGYVETMLGRRRYLPDISSTNSANKAHASRQAVNTTIQGSAADLTKSAMIAVDAEVRKRSKSAVLSSDSSAKGAYLVLQLHDELVYEVSNDYADDFVKIIRKAMETAMTLSVKLPVKVKTGLSWGSLQEVQ